MKFLHTSDWHLGQQFYHYDRTYEHHRFLEWLLAVLREEQIDVLLLSGDVFDVSNPSAVSVRMFYRFLIEAVKENPFPKSITSIRLSCSIRKEPKW